MSKATETLEVLDYLELCAQRAARNAHGQALYDLMTDVEQIERLRGAVIQYEKDGTKLGHRGT